MELAQDVRGNTSETDGGKVSSRLKESLLRHLKLKLYLAVTTKLRFNKVTLT